MTEHTHQPEATDVHVGQAIRARRKILGVTQSALADKIGVTFQQVQKYERAANRVSCSTLIDICKALACQPQDLLPDSDGGSFDLAESLQMATMPGGLELMQAWMALPAAQRQAVTRLAVDLHDASDAEQPGRAYVIGGHDREGMRHDA